MREGEAEDSASKVDDADSLSSTNYVVRPKEAIFNIETLKMCLSKEINILETFYTMVNNIEHFVLKNK